MTGIELRALRRLRREQEPPSQFLFVSERGDPFSSDGFARMLQRVAETAGMTSLVIRSAYAPACMRVQLANDGQDTRAIQSFLGHKNIQHTVRYTELAPNRLKISGATEPLRFWKVPPIAGIVKLEPAPVGQTGAGKFQ